MQRSQSFFGKFCIIAIDSPCLSFNTPNTCQICRRFHPQAMKKLLFTTVFLAASFLITSLPYAYSTPLTTLAQQGDDGSLLTPQLVQQTAKSITVRITWENNGGSGVIIAKKGDTYLILTNAHVVRRAKSIAIQAPDGQKYQAKSIDGGFDPKYDLALLQFTSQTKYSQANLKGIAGTPIEPTRKIYSSGFPFDSKDIRITSGEVSQLTDIPFDDGTQIGYVTNKGEKGLRQGMSGGAIFDAQGIFLGINTLGIAPILPNYTYEDGSKPLPKLAAQYTRANWGIPVYNFLTHVKADILYSYDNLRQTKVEHQTTPKRFMAKLNDTARKKTVRIENSGNTGSGVIVASEGNSYYVLTARHVVQDEKNNTRQKFTDGQIITYDQDSHPVTSTVVAEGVDLAVVKFTSNNKYPIAQLGEYSQNDRDFIFVGGFPDRGKINSPLWQWQLNPGTVNDPEQGKLQIQTNQSFSNGYDLIYGSISYGGMSGGPVFDTTGNVIGIHGRAEFADLHSLGISIKTFTGLLDKLYINPNLLKVKTNPVELKSEERDNLIETMQNIPKPQSGDDGERWLAYANQLYRTHQLSDAVGAFDKAIAKDQKLFGNYGKTLSLMWTDNELALKAITQAINAVTSNEFSAKYYYLWKYQSHILKELERYDEALRSIDIAISKEKNDLILMNEKGIILSANKQYDRAISIFDDIIIRQGKSTQSYTYNNRGLTKHEMGDNQGAIVDYDRAIALNPKYALAYYNRGVAKYKMGDNQGTIVDYNRVIALNPKYALAYNNRGAVKYKMGDKQGAIVDYDRAIAINPKYIDAYYNRGNAKSDLGDNQEATKDYDRAIAINPKYIDAYVNRGLAKSDLGNKQDAIVDYDRAIAINPKYALAYNNRGFAKYELGNKQDAIVDYDRAIAINPKYAKAYYNRSNAKSDLGNKQGAIIDMSKAVELYREKGQTESYKDAIGKLEKLKRQ
jgi:tetratricopeptide (TPR) repeat protein/S1-C subfamily serine protease